MDPQSRSALETVLVVDDDYCVLRTMDVRLRDLGYTVLLAADGRHALRLAARRRPDIVILDLRLPDIRGVELVGRLRCLRSAPIIVLAARSTEAEKVAALDAGANDFLTKPFGFAEFTARLRVALRVSRPHDSAPAIETDAFTLDLEARRARVRGRDVRLTATEWQIVEVLACNPGRLVSQQELLEQVWGLSNTKNNYVRVYLSSIRRKLEPDPASPRYFLTEPRSGIRFDPGGEAPRRRALPLQPARARRAARALAVAEI